MSVIPLLPRRETEIHIADVIQPSQPRVSTIVNTLETLGELHDLHELYEGI